MTSESFTTWLAKMKSAGLARSDAECGRLLGVTVNTVLAYKAKGASRVVGLACWALLHRGEPYSA